MGAQHTPGPWEWVVDRFRGGFSGIVGPDGSEVLFPNTANDGDTGAAWFEDFPSDADRKLIAAAPAMAEALLWFIQNDDTNEGDTPMPEHGGKTWNEINAYWIDGLRKAHAALAAAGIEVAS